MSAARLHSRLFETQARELDRRVRERFIAGGQRPEYARNFQQDLQHLLAYSHAGIEVKGKMGWAKRLLRRIMRPIITHQDRVHRLMIERLADLHESLIESSERWSQSAASASAELDSRLLEFRAEMLALQSWPRDQAGVEPMKKGQLNGQSIPLGSRVVVGELAIRREGYCHVAKKSGPNVDRVAPPHDLPAEPGSLVELVVANVLEEYPAVLVRDLLLPYWKTLLADDGVLTLVADDVGAMLDRHEDGSLDEGELLEALFAPLANGAARKSAFTPESLRRMLEEAGFQDAFVLDRRQSPENHAFGFVVRATSRVRRADEVLA